MKKILACFWFLLSNLCVSADYSEKTVIYDANGNVSNYTAPYAGEISYSYDPLNRLTGIHCPDGKTIKYAHDHNSNLIAIADDHGMTSYSYDALNRLTKVLFPGNISITYEYDQANKPVEIIYPDQEEAKYDYGIITEYSYGKLHRVINVSHRESNGAFIAEYQFTYDNNNNCTSVRELAPSEAKSTAYLYDKLNRLVEINYSDGRFGKYVYDGAGNRLAKITQNGSIDYEYDNHYRLIRAGETYFYYDVSGDLIKKTSNGKNTHFGYDTAGRLISYDNGEDKVTFAYDERSRLVEVSERDRTIHYFYDERDLITRIFSPFGEITYSYDQNGNVLSKTDSLGLISTFVYDENDNLIKAIDALRGVSLYEYNSFSDLIKIILPNGSVIEIRYDAFERPVVLK